MEAAAEAPHSKSREVLWDGAAVLLPLAAQSLLPSMTITRRSVCARTRNAMAQAVDDFPDPVAPMSATFMALVKPASYQACGSKQNGAPLSRVPIKCPPAEGRGVVSRGRAVAAAIDGIASARVALAVAVSHSALAAGRTVLG